MSLIEATRLFWVLLERPDSECHRAANDWDYSVSRESLVLMDLADIVASALGSKEKSVHGRPWDAPELVQSTLSNEEMKALLRGLKAGTVEGTPLSYSKITVDSEDEEH